MKIIKGVVIGTMFAVGTAMMYKEGMLNAGNKFLKKGKKFAKKIGVM